MPHTYKMIGVLFGFSLVGTTAYADQVTCPDGIHFVNIGTSIDQFKSICGAPTSTASSNAPGSASGYYLWTYKNTLPNPTYSAARQTTTVVMGPPATTAFVIENGKVGAIRITNFGQSTVTQQTTCGRQNVSVGVTTNQLRLLCGAPESVQQLTKMPGQSGQALPEQTILQYQTQSYMPMVSYSFANGQLVGKN